MSKTPINVTKYRDLKDKYVEAPGTPEREQFDQALKSELAGQIPVVILHIEGEGDFTITRERFDAYAADFEYDEGKHGIDQVVAQMEARLHACADDNGFNYADISSLIDMNQTRTQAQLDALPEWGSF